MEGTTLMAKKEKTPQEIFAEQFVSELQPKTVEDVENGLKSIFGPIFESMLKGELSAHLGYESNDHNPKSTTNRRNGSTKNTPSTVLLPMIWMAARTSWGSGLTNPKINISGCRSLMN